jgi:hypothetical protein
LWQLGPFKQFCDRAGTATSGVFVFVGGIDIAKSYGILRNRVDFCNNVINTRPVAVHVNDITHRESSASLTVITIFSAFVAPVKVMAGP